MEHTSNLNERTDRLSDEALDNVAGGVYRWIRAIAIAGRNNEGQASTNTQLWVTTAT